MRAASRCRSSCSSCALVSFQPSRRGASLHMCHASFHATRGSCPISASVGMGMFCGRVAAARRCASVSSSDDRLCLWPSPSAGPSVPRKHSGRAPGRNLLAGDRASAAVAAYAPSAFSVAAARCSGSAFAHASTASAEAPVAARAEAVIHSAYALAAVRCLPSPSGVGASREAA